MSVPSVKFIRAGMITPFQVNRLFGFRIYSKVIFEQLTKLKPIAFFGSKTHRAHCYDLEASLQALLGLYARRDKLNVAPSGRVRRLVPEGVADVVETLDKLKEIKNKEKPSSKVACSVCVPAAAEPAPDAELPAPHPESAEYVDWVQSHIKVMQYIPYVKEFGDLIRFLDIKAAGLEKRISDLEELVLKSVPPVDPATPAT